MAIRITRVYTRTGDDGMTALVGGKRVPKDAARIEAYGTVDELNAVVGLVRAWNEEGKGQRELHLRLDAMLQAIQQELFDLGSELATPEDFTYDGMHRMGEEEVTRIERVIDECQEELEPLKSFILPGGGRISAQASSVPHGVPAGRAGDPRVVADRERRRVAAALRQPVERSLLCAGAMGGEESGGDGVPLATGIEVAPTKRSAPADSASERMRAGVGNVGNPCRQEGVDLRRGQ